MTHYASLIDPEYLTAARGKLSEWPDMEVRYSSSGKGRIILQSFGPRMVSEAEAMCNHQTIHGKTTWNKNSFDRLRCSKCYAIKAI